MLNNVLSKPLSFVFVYQKVFSEGYDESEEHVKPQFEEDDEFREGLFNFIQI